MTYSMEGKVALITGGTSGIGLTTAQAFTKAGAKVAIVGTNAQKGEAALSTINGASSDAIYIQADVSQAEQVRAMVNKVGETFGRLDYAFNNAGVGNGLNSVTELAEDMWDTVIDINLKGVWLCMKYEIQTMLKSGGGAIVNTSSAAGSYGMPGMTAYVASKHGVIGLTKSVAMEFATAGIRVNTISPGFIETPMITPMLGSPEMKAKIESTSIFKRIGKPEEIADAVIWLCSDEASFVTAANFAVDGGMSEQIIHPFS